jgi:8-oxo-dGTP pyrophosphatase MutT (NUDIX family)
LKKKSQIYKIYINEVEVILSSTSKLSDLPLDTTSTLVSLYNGKVKYLFNFIDLCEKKCKYQKVVIHYFDFYKLYEDFYSIYAEIEAAGGLIKNEFNEFLFIYRRGYWDLPKGKIELNESKKHAAIREVKEETGITNIKFIDKIIKTYHTYKLIDGKRIIKKSHWYLMEVKKQPLVPQSDEDIEKAEWLNLDKFLNECKPVYKNIFDVVYAYKQLELDKQ